MIGLLALAALAGCDRQSPAPVQANASVAAEPPASPDEAPATGPAAGAGKTRPDYSHAGEPMPAVAFTGPDGKPVALSAFKGKPLLVNLWATWCAPCVAEMPTLDTLAKAHAGKLTVVAVNQDTDPARAAAFWGERKLGNLQLYRDPEVKLSVAYAANLPTTVLYDAGGREVVRVTGGMDWTGAGAAALLAKAGI